MQENAASALATSCRVILSEAKDPVEPCDPLATAGILRFARLCQNSVERVIPSVERGIWVGAFPTRREKGPAARIPRSTLGMTHRVS